MQRGLARIEKGTPLPNQRTSGIYFSVDYKVHLESNSSPSRERAIHCLANSNELAAKNGFDYHPNQCSQLESFVLFPSTLSTERCASLQSLDNPVIYI